MEFTKPKDLEERVLPNEGYYKGSMMSFTSAAPCTMLNGIVLSNNNNQQQVLWHTF
jgi:hypothetical protein